MTPPLVCQLCCIPFDVCRIGKFNEPPDRALIFNGPGEIRRFSTGPGRNDQKFEAKLKIKAAARPGDRIEDILGGSEGCGADGCRHIGIAPDNDPLGHMAGPLCYMTEGYNGYWVATEEMIERSKLCSLRYNENWGIGTSPDNDICFVVEDGGFQNTSNDFGMDEVTGRFADLPMHPSCFEMFKRISKGRFGKVDVVGLWMVRAEWGSPVKQLWSNPNVLSNDDAHLASRVAGLQLPSDLNIVLPGDEYKCQPGTEYLATDPLNVLGLEDLIRDGSKGRSSDLALASPKSGASSDDVLSRLPFELRQMIADHLPRKDMLSLRIASAAFTERLQSYFQRLILREMPWVWEIDDLSAKEVNWYGLWMKLSAADGGSYEDQKKRIWGYRQSEQLEHWIKITLDKKKSGENRTKMYRDASKQGREDIMERFRELKATGMWKNDKKTTELRGLRNRRRIYHAIDQILDHIAHLRSTDPQC